MLRFFLCGLLLICTPYSSLALPLDSLRAMLQRGMAVQEKVYVHTDNSCYFIGDTLWYKAYVVRSDNHHPTNMSKLLYVELLSPDGLVVERQQTVVNGSDNACGQFALPDSLYSGFYEIRAYTRWMLNFNVSHRRYTREDRQLFYSNAMAADYYRDWEGLYSRVLPIYSKPQEAGNYDGKYMYERPKQEMPFTPKRELKCNFYPEGGMLVEGLTSRVAFDLTDQDGQAVALTGTLSTGGEVSTAHMGRGTFLVTPAASGRATLTFNWEGKDYEFKLPQAASSGVVVTMESGQGLDGNRQLTVAAKGMTPAAYAVTCRGKIYVLEALTGTGKTTVDVSQLPSGVNELMILDENGEVMADRLFFVDHHDTKAAMTVKTDKLDYTPYEPVVVTLRAEGAAKGTPVSISVRDWRTEEATYNNGNMMTDMLLSSDLRGFVAQPAYYFEKDDQEHRNALDVLMMVQGWRKYGRVKTSKTEGSLGLLAAQKLRYAPERTTTIEGTVSKQLGVKILTIEDVEGLNSQKSLAAESLETAENAVTYVSSDEEDEEDSDDSTEEEDDTDDTDTDDNDGLGVEHRRLKHEVMVEAELNKDGQTAGATQMTTDGGKFCIQIPPFYDYATLFITAYEQKDSAKYCLTSRLDKDRMNEEAYPNFYVKRDLFYPVFAHPYDYYQTHEPDTILVHDIFDDSENEGKLKGEHYVQTVKVDAKRRSRRAVDYTKPAYVVDAYRLYNEATDRGLSWGVANMGTFPSVACQTVYGNMNRRNSYNIVGKVDKYTFYRNIQGTDETINNRAYTAVFTALHLRRILNFRFYTD